MNVHCENSWFSRERRGSVLVIVLVIIVMLTLGALTFGTLGTVVGSGCLPWSGNLWQSRTWGSVGSKNISVVWSSGPLIAVTHIENLGVQATVQQKRWKGTGWLFQTNIDILEPTDAAPSDQYFRSWMLMVSFVIPLIVAVVLAAYPTIAFIRGPLRRWRRRRKGLCLKCGYDLTGNVSGVCPECGTRLPQG